MKASTERKFTALPDGRVKCNLLCFQRGRFEEAVHVNERSHVCVAYGTLLLSGTRLSDETPLNQGRVCVAAEESENQQEL